MSKSYDKGNEGEMIAVNHLTLAGLQVMETRWKDKAYELDIIAFDPTTQEMVFVEVKTRSSIVWGRPEDAVDFKKIRRCVRAADFYLRSRSINYPARFDVVSVLMAPNKEVEVEHIRNAFYAPLGR